MADKIDQIKLNGTAWDISLPADSNEVLNFAASFSSSVAYAVGALVTYDGSLYRCTQAHAAGTWNAAHFTKVTVQPLVEIVDLRS